jgi:hypothetical protein
VKEILQQLSEAWQKNKGKQKKMRRSEERDNAQYDKDDRKVTQERTFQSSPKK